MTHPRPSRRAVLDALPLILGYAPFGLVFGATVAASPISDLAGWASSPLVFAGASQLALVELFDSRAAPVVIIATVLVINLRHVMYSGALAPWFRDSPLWWQVTAPHLLADPVYTLSAVRFPQLPEARDRRRYYATFGGMVFVAWCAMTAVGILAGAQLPDAIDLDIAIPLVFLALLVPSVVDRPTLVAGIVGGVVAVAAMPLPYHLGLLVGALSGIGAGVLVDEEI